jgi:hypothetical protein
MVATLLTLLATCFQTCAGPTCSPTSFYTYPRDVVVRSSWTVPLSVPVESTPAWSWQRVTKDGIPFYAWGYTDSVGAFNWGSDNPPINRAQYDAAKAAVEKAAKKAEEQAKEPAQAKVPDKPNATDGHATGDVSPVAASYEDRAESARPGPSAPEGTVVKLSNGSKGYGYGVDPFKIHEHAKQREYYYTNAGEDQQSERKRDIHLTLIGSKEDRDKVLEDLKSDAELKAAASRAMIQDYDPGDWEVDPSLNFPTGGKPDILIQAQDGSVLWRANNYKDVGPEGLTEALRKADPSYDPSKDPQPGGDGGPKLPLGSKEMWIAIGAVIVLLMLLPTRSD